MAKKILVLGASKGTGALAVQEALSRGHTVSAFARTPERLGISDSKLTLVKGDFLDRESVMRAVPGHDAVIVSPGVTALSEFKQRPDFFSRGTGFALEALQAQPGARIVILGALGTGPSAPLLPPVIGAILRGWLLRLPYADHEVQERLVMNSAVPWVIARPARLTDGPAKHRYVKTAALERVPSSISRADVAHFLVDACERDEWLGKAVQLGG